MKKYIDKFLDLHLKACVFEDVGFQEHKQQYCAGLPEDMRTYINAQKPRTIATVIHHSMLATKIFASSSTKVVAKPSEREEKQSKRQGDSPPNGKKIANEKKVSDANKGKEKGQYKGNCKLSPEELEQY